MKLFYILLTGYLLTGCGPDKEKHSLGEQEVTPADLIGKTVEYRYGESVYQVTFDSNKEMHWEAIAGDEKGAYEEEVYIIDSIDKMKLFITWGEANGIGVSQVLDFGSGIVYNHLLRGREANAGKGKIRILDR